jgi:hypothetical protein
MTSLVVDPRIRWLNVEEFIAKLDASPSGEFCAYAPLRGKNKHTFCGNSILLLNKDNITSKVQYRCDDCLGKIGCGYKFILQYFQIIGRDISCLEEVNSEIISSQSFHNQELTLSPWKQCENKAKQLSKSEWLTPEEFLSRIEREISESPKNGEKLCSFRQVEVNFVVSYVAIK